MFSSLYELNFLYIAGHEIRLLPSLTQVQGNGLDKRSPSGSYPVVYSKPTNDNLFFTLLWLLNPFLFKTKTSPGLWRTVRLTEGHKITPTLGADLSSLEPIIHRPFFFCDVWPVLLLIARPLFRFEFLEVYINLNCDLSSLLSIDR